MALKRVKTLARTMSARERLLRTGTSLISPRAIRASTSAVVSPRPGPGRTARPAAVSCFRRYGRLIIFAPVCPVSSARRKTSTPRLRSASRWEGRIAGARWRPFFKALAEPSCTGSGSGTPCVLCTSAAATLCSLRLVRWETATSTLPRDRRRAAVGGHQDTVRLVDHGPRLHRPAQLLQLGMRTLRVAHACPNSTQGDQKCAAGTAGWRACARCRDHTHVPAVDRNFGTPAQRGFSPGPARARACGGARETPSDPGSSAPSATAGSLRRCRPRGTGARRCAPARSPTRRS